MVSLLLSLVSHSWKQVIFPTLPSSEYLGPYTTVPSFQIALCFLCGTQALEFPSQKDLS